MPKGFRCALGVALTALLLSGCSASYVVRMTVVRPDSERPELSPAEVEAAVAAIADATYPFGLRPTPQIERLKEMSEEEAYFAYRIIADFTREPGSGRPGQVLVTVGIHKETGRLAVVITDLHALWQSSDSRNLEVALRTALESRFPPVQIDVERNRIPLLFGP